MKRKMAILTAALLSLPVIITPVLALANEFCSGCHLSQYDKINASKHSSLVCETCHEGADAHFYDQGMPKTIFPKVHFDMEICMNCHPDQYDSFLKEVPGKTFYGGSDSGPNAPKGWSRTKDFPYWNSIIDGNPFVLEAYEDRSMKHNQIDAQGSIRPKAEACLECHGTRVAYYMGINYVDPAGGNVSYPAKNMTIKNQHGISAGTSVYNQTTGAWDAGRITLNVPAGTKVSTYVDGVNEPRYQVKTVVKLPDGRIYASYDYPGATATGSDTDTARAEEARNWIYAALEAFAFDGLNYTFTSTDSAKAYQVTGYNSPSIESGEVCTYCHDPMSTGLRIIRKSLIEAIARNGINPYAGEEIKNFGQAGRQDQIIAVCAQCHSEYVGGYSSVDGIDRDFVPWGKPAEMESLYMNLFNYTQDWLHGKPIRPWQTMTPNARGYYPAGSIYTINEKLIKSQNPEAEVFWNSVMYRAGVTCTDCHAANATNITTGKNYTSHWFTSPVNLLSSGINTCGRSEACHPAEGEPLEFMLGEIKTIQDTFFNLQKEVQLSLIDSLIAINTSRTAGINVDKAVQDYRKAMLRWEYYALAENSMGFHNRAEALNELEAALSTAIEIKNLTGDVKPIGPCTTVSKPGTYMLLQDLKEIRNVNTCIFITSSDVVLDGNGHAIEGSGFSKGVFVYNETKTLMNVTVKNLNVTNWRVGIYYRNSENGRIENNTANLNTDKGIEVEYSSNITIINNTANLDVDHGIEIESSNNNIIANNIANRNFDHGIEIDRSSNNTITNNTANLNNFAGIELEWSSNDNSVINNNLNWNDWGIYIEASSNNTITDNTANENNMLGIYLESSSGNVLINNTALNNGNWDFYSEDGSIGNIVTNLNINHSISFTGKDIAIRATSSPASDPEGYRNINKYIEVEKSRVAEREPGYIGDSWIFLNVSYNDSDVPGLNESSLRMQKYNGSWSLVSGTYGVETGRNYVYANTTEFGIFALMAELPPDVTSGLAVFVRSLDDGVWTQNWDGSTWSTWQSLGGIVASNIAATSSGNNITIFARGRDNGVWTRKWNGSIWSTWQNLGGIITSEISATSSGSNIDLFVRGADDDVWTQSWDGSTWSGWQSLGGIVASNIAATSSGVNITIFARGTDDSLWTRNWNGTIWSTWQSLGGIIRDDPDSVSSTGRTHVFVRGPDNSVWTKNRDGSIWSGWQSLGGTVTSNISSSAEAGNITIFVVGQDNGLWTQNWNGNVWSGSWQSLGGTVTSDPDSVSSTGRRYTFVRGPDNGVWTQSYDGILWSGWQSLGGLTIGAPEVTS